MVNPLDVWRGQTYVGRLTRTRSGLRFAYAQELLDRIGLNTAVISLALPTATRPYADRHCLPFFDGLLPEGEMRRIVAYDFGIAESDTFGLLNLLGRDCAGALSLVPAGEPPAEPSPVDQQPAVPRSSIDGLIRHLRVHPLGVDNALRASLGGVQEKLLLTRRGDDRWALPSAEVASTHLLKPEIPGLPGSVPNEACCLRFAAALGVPAAAVAVDRFGDRDVLIVERFDRSLSADGTVERYHQETACQALAVPVAASARKYEDAGGPSLRQIAALLTTWTRSEALEGLLRQTVVNTIVGNADAHAMNHSFTIDDDGQVGIAPMYDVFSTLWYPRLSTTAGMFIGGQRDLRSVTAAHLVDEATTWGVTHSRARSIVEELLTDAPAALSASIDATDGLPDRFGEFLFTRIDALRRRLAGGNQTSAS